MPWVNIFEHEACEVVIRLTLAGNDYPPEAEDVFPVDRNPSTPQHFGSESNVGLYANDWNIDGPAIGVPPETWAETFSWGMYIIPSGGIAGRRFRARVLQQTSAINDPWPEEGLLQCPGYFVEGCGWIPAFDEASLVPYNPDGEPPVDSEWYEFEEVAAEPDAGGLENTGWVGLLNFDAEGSTAFARGFFEWQVWVEGSECSYDCSCDPESGSRNTDTLGSLRSRLIHRLGFVDPLGANEVRTLADFRRALMIRLGFAANASNPPAGMLDLVDEIVNESQQLLWRSLELDQDGDQPQRMVDPEDENTLDYPLVFAYALGQAKAHYNKPDAKLYLDQAQKQLTDYMRRSPPSIVRLAGDFLKEAQRFLYDKVASFRQSRFFYWPLQQGVRFYDFAENADPCERRFVPELVEGVYVTHGDDCTTERWQELHAGINPLLYNGGVSESWPQRYEFRQCIELFPAPDDRPGYLRIKAKFDLQPFEEDEDHTTIDADLVFLQALALAKAHFDQKDAREVAALVQSKIGDIIAGSHHTRRYIPSDGECPPASPPRARDGFIEN